LQEVIGAGGLSACGLGVMLARPGVAEALTTALQDTQVAAAEPGNAAAFWSSFLDPQPHARGLFHKAPGTDSDRQVNFLHYSDDKGLRYSEQIEPGELPDFPGDIQASMNVGGVRLSSQDRQTFENKRSAQLRIDLLQGQGMYNMVPPLAWMALAGIFPSKAGSLPPLQNLSFDPSSSMQNMNQIVLPQGLAHLAFNISMLPRENPFFNVLNMLATNTARLAPILGLPAISITALNGFSQLYGMMENHTTFLFQARPQLAYTTQQARQAANTSIGMNLPAGDYVLVPQTHTDDLKPYLTQLKLVNGYLVDKSAPASSSVYEQALSTKPDISYVTVNVGVKPMTQVGYPQPPSSGPGTSPSKSSSSSSSKKKS
jgi:hypothetical protein